MATYRKMLKDYEGNNIIPLGTDGANIEVTNVDPGEGEDLGENDFIAVYGSMPDDKLVYADDPTELENPLPHVGTSDIEDGAVTSNKIDWSSIGNMYQTHTTANPFTVSSTWTLTLPNSTWNHTFENVVVGAKYLVIANCGYSSYNSGNTEMDFAIQVTGASSPAFPEGMKTVTNTGSNNTAFGRIVIGVYQATSTTLNIKCGFSCGATGSYRADGGHVILIRIG